MSKSFGLGIDVPSLYLDESEAMIGRPRNLSLGMPAYNEDIAVPRLLASSGSLRCFLLLQCNQLALPFFGSYGDFTESAFFGQVDHESLVIRDSRLWILRAFDIRTAAPMSEGPSSTEFYMLNAEESHEHDPISPQDAIRFLHIFNEFCFEQM